MQNRLMPALALMVIGLTAGCTAYDHELVDDIEVVRHEYDAVRKMAPQGPLFNQGLRQGYLDYGDLQYDGAEIRDFAHFAFKAVDSAKGEMVLPDSLDGRGLDSGEHGALAAGRARLMAALEQTGRKKAPKEAAAAQVAFDCWLDRSEERAAPELIEECKRRFEDNAATVERSLASDENNVYLVFFAWDQADLSPVANTVLDQVEADFAAGRHARVVVAGHADRSGPDAYNESLSERRARTVAEALAARDLPASAMAVEWHGERQPRVAQADGTKEPQNRRVEITFR